jgi:hypothetical protein
MLLVGMVNFFKKNVGGCGSVAVPPPPRTSCRPRQGVWRGGGTATLPQPPIEHTIISLNYPPLSIISGEGDHDLLLCS